MIRRIKEACILEKLNDFKAVAIVGPRQVGKSTLSRHINVENIVYLDLERPADLSKLDDPEAFLKPYENQLVCIDEVQLKPDLFPVLRYILDQNRNYGQLLLLGSASPELIQKSSETLAGRIWFEELTPFLLQELETDQFKRLWLKGGYPESFLKNENSSFSWREAYVKTFLERDLGMLGFRRSPIQMRRFWTMLAHCHGEVINYSKLAQSLDVSVPTVKSFVTMMEETFMIRVLSPYHANIKKRLVKSPRVYIRDSGILHFLLQIDNFDGLMGHPIYGKSYEGFVIEQILNSVSSRWEASFFRTSTGDELDLVLEKGQKKIAIEIKASTAPKLTSSNQKALDIVKPHICFVVSLSEDTYQKSGNVIVTNLEGCLQEIGSMEV